jgi:hypothetical protein
MEPLFGKVVILERHNVKGHRSGPIAAREIDYRSNLYVFARHDMHFRHVMSVVQHIAFHRCGQVIEKIVSRWISVVRNIPRCVLNDKMMMKDVGEVKWVVENGWTVQDERLGSRRVW